MKLSQAVAERIRNILKEKNISQYRLEKEINMPHNTLKSLMKATNSGVNLRTVFQVACGLNMSIAEFFDDKIFDRENFDD